MFLKRLIIGAVLLMMIAFASGFRSEKQAEELPGSFSQGDIVISQGQVIEKLLVVDGTATVAGRVTHWGAVIGGDLIITTTGDITGGVFVLNGQLTVEPGANFAPSLQIILPPGSPLIALLECILVTSVLAVPVVSTLVVLFSVRWFRRVDGYNLLRQHFPGPSWRWPSLFALVGLAVCGFLLAVFVHLARETVFYHEADFFDQIIIWLARYHANPIMDKMMLTITYVGSGYAYIVLAPMILAALFWRKRWREGFSLTVCLAGASVLNFLLKHLFERARPDAFRVVSESGYSFPSGHAMVSLCFYGMIAYLWGREMPIAARRLTLYGLTVVMILAIGFSRIYLGVHYPSDVLGGYLAGATWLVFCMAMLWWWEVKRTDC